MTLELREVEKLALCREGMTSAYRAGMILQEKGWMLFPAASWNRPAILAFDGETCVAGVNWSRDDDDGSACVNFAWCAPEKPAALALCFLRFRASLRKHPPSWLSFTCHDGNEQMQQLVRRMKLRPHSHSYRVPSEFFESKETGKGVSFFGRLREAVSAFINQEAQSWQRQRGK